MKKSPEKESGSIVMIGSFNPTIFQPRWLGSQGLIRPEEAENAKITIIQAEVTDFSTEWFQLQALLNRFQLVSTDLRQYSPLRDLAAAIFTILPHTPVTKVGINRTFHFKMPSTASWHAIGHILAPKEPWNPIMEGPGLRSIFMQGRRKQAEVGLSHVKVEPSAMVEHGIYVEVNEEFNAPAPDGIESEGASWVPDRLNEHWDAILKFSEVAADHLLSLVDK